jgi:prephenate dehydratase
VAATVAAPSRIAFAGERGSFAEDAVVAYAPGTEAWPVPGFREVFEGVSGGDGFAAGMLPIENLVNGTVREVYDLLLEHELEIVGEVIVPVRLCLAALPGESVESIERVYSHIQALGQAEAFLRSRPWQLLTTYNTAGSGRMIAERQEAGAAAVLSPRAAALFGLEVLVGDIQTEPRNRTRFLVVTRPGEGPPAEVAAPVEDRPRRTTLAMTVENRPGSLHECLGVLKAHGLNMDKLESRPSRVRAWEYVFWIDTDADLRDPEVRAAFRELAAVSSTLRILGSYAKAEERGA